MAREENKVVHFDLCVIGAGAAGLSIAAGAVQLGLDVALVEGGEMGGDCLNTGCVPSKALLAAGRAAQNMRMAGKFGIKAIEPEVDFRAVRKHVQGVIATIEPHDSQDRFEAMGIKVFRSFACFIDKNMIMAGDDRISAKNFVIATGSSPFVPPINGLEPDKVLTNENIFALEEKPEHLIIIGGGPIGIEMAQAHKRLGCQVTIVELGSIMQHDEPSLVQVVRERLLAENVYIHENASILKVEHKADGSVDVDIENEDIKGTLSGSHLLVATGRSANIDGLDLDKAGVKAGRRGIETDKRLRSSNKRIFAAGDVAGGPQFTHIAGYHAGIIIRNLIFKVPAKVDYRALPWVTYSDPELAHVGISVAQAREKYGKKINILNWRFKENDRAVTEREENGAIIVITDKRGRILGASIVGPHAGELIGTWCLAISEGLKIGAIANMIAPYPTFGEINKRVAGSYYTSSLFSDRTRLVTGLLAKLPF